MNRYEWTKEQEEYIRKYHKRFSRIEMMQRINFIFKRELREKTSYKKWRQWDLSRLILSLRKTAKRGFAYIVSRREAPKNLGENGRRGIYPRIK